MSRWHICFALPYLISVAHAQIPPKPDVPKAPSAKAESPKEPYFPPVDSLLKGLAPREIGPTVTGGRIVDIAVYEKVPRIFYVASASGGLWKTENGGITFTPGFDREASVSLGAVAVQQNDPNVVWVGSGEYTSRNSVAWGDGVYKSVDGGKTWKNLGLGATMHISRIVIDPLNPNTVFVAATGHLWGPNKERGIYKTTDGGKSWNLILFADEQTGAGDLAMNPANHNELIAAMWTRDRKPWTFVSGGPKSGLFKTTDGGKTWRPLATGLPATRVGRIGLSYFRKDPKIILACVENADKGGIYRSMDGGDTWKQLSKTNPRPFYFSRILQDPSDIKRIYMPGVTLLYSTDEGKEFKAMKSSIHVDHHAIWVDPKDSNHILIGTDGGVGQSRDRGLNWEHLNNMSVGQYYAVCTDMRRPYWVYGGLQDNGSWGAPTQTRQGGTAAFHTVNVGGGDGFYVQVDPTDWHTVYSESQGGFIDRVDQVTGEDKGIKPSVRGEKLRFNWSTPFIISPHNPRTLYIGGNRLFKTVNRGEAWKPISPDLTTNNRFKQRPGLGSVIPENTGAEAHCTITTISESPVRQGVLWAGTDDGQLWLTQDDGATWTNTVANIPGLPKNTWCSRILASRVVEARAYATFDGHRTSDFKPYVYVTEDFGKTWTSLANGLPDGDNLYVIKEGLKNGNLLVLGSELSLRFSLDRGKNWVRIDRSQFPTVAVHDLVIQPKEQDLVIGTHGRGIWTMDISALEGIDKDTFNADAAVFQPQDVLDMGRVDTYEWGGDRTYLSKNTQPGTHLFFWTKAADPKALLVVSDITGQRSDEYNVDAKPGLNSYVWNGKIKGKLALGEYRVTLKTGGKEYVTSVKVAPAPDVQ